MKRFFFKSSKTNGVIRKIIEKIRIIDTHEHIQPEDIRLNGNQILKKVFPFNERRFDTTDGEFRAMKIAARDLYGVDLSRGVVLENLYQKMLEKNKKGLYKWILGKKSGIDLALTADWPVDRLGEAKDGILVPVLDMDFFVLLHDKSSLGVFSRSCGIQINTLADLIAALDAEMERYSPFIVAFKIVAACSRTIEFKKVEQYEAEKAFNEISSARHITEFPQPSLPGKSSAILEPIDIKEVKKLQDYLVHRIIRFSVIHNLPIIFRTGWPGRGPNILENFNPVNLTNLFLEYPNAKFICCHGGYPFSRELGALASMFRNVFIEISWLHHIPPIVTRSSLSEWLECVPVNQILAFCGDALHVEWAYGASVIAKDSIVKVLSEKVENEFYTLEEAERVAKRILRENAMELFHLSTDYIRTKGISKKENYSNPK